jgi:hypothetical protein
MASQVAFSDGARPNLLSLPIGMMPVTLGVLLLPVGLLLGVIHGNPRFRAGTICILGAALLLFMAIQTPFGAARVGLVASLGAGAVGLALCLLGLRSDRQSTPSVG